MPDSTGVSRQACDDQPVHPELISTAIRGRLGSNQAAADVSDVGRVISIGDGIARVSGVDGAMLGEMLETRHAAILATLADGKAIDSSLASLLDAALEEFDTVRRTAGLAAAA